MLEQRANSNARGLNIDMRGIFYLHTKVHSPHRHRIYKRETDHHYTPKTRGMAGLKRKLMLMTEPYNVEAI